jgi:asparagine synthetase B (glutamine-hydrolysing)
MKNTVPRGWRSCAGCGFAIWDDKQRTLFLARDRVGIKPLYYCLTPRFLSFGSEIKAILADPEVEREIDRTMIDRFLTFYYMPGEQTPFKNIFKLPPGSCLMQKMGTQKYASGTPGSWMSPLPTSYTVLAGS